MAHVTILDHLQTKSDTISNSSLVAQTALFVKDIALVPDDKNGLQVYRLKKQVPKALGVHGHFIEQATCEDYHKQAIALGLT